MNSTNERLVTDEVTDDDRKAALAAFFAGQKQRQAEQRIAAEQAFESIDRLVAAMAQKTDQSYTLRALLYSLWNGKAASLVEVVSLDWSLRRDLCCVIAAFGFEERGGIHFFYDAIKAAVVKEALFDWFIAEREEKEAA